MAGESGVPDIPSSVYQRLAALYSRGQFTVAALEAEAAKLGIGVQDLINGVSANLGSRFPALRGWAGQVAEGIAQLRNSGALPAVGVGVGAGAAGGTGAAGGAGVAGKLGAISLGTILWGVLIGGGLLAAGGYIYVNSGDQPVKAGPAMLRDRATPPPNPTAIGGGGPYVVALLTKVSGGSVWVGQEAILKTTPTCRFAGGGLCQGNDPPVEYTVKAGPFKAATDATAAWCKELRGKKVTYRPVAGDSTASVYGGEYWIGLAPGCPAS